MQLTYSRRQIKRNAARLCVGDSGLDSRLVTSSAASSTNALVIDSIEPRGPDQAVAVRDYNLLVCHSSPMIKRKTAFERDHHG